MFRRNKMKRVRGFEVAGGWEGRDINLPERQTKNSAGYDFEAAEDVEIPPVWAILLNSINRALNGQSVNIMPEIFKPTLVHTGVKSYMPDDEALFMYNRSSNPLKRFLLLANGVGVVDSDYYGNFKNDGEIMFQFINFGINSVVIRKGERIGQGIFKKFLKADNDNATGEREGGHGST